MTKLLYVVDNSGTRCGNKLCFWALFKITYMSPSTDIRTERNVENFIHTVLLQYIKNISPAAVKRYLDRGRADSYYLLSVLEISPKTIRIVLIASCVVIAYLNARAAAYALIGVDVKAHVSVFVVFNGIRLDRRANSYAVVAGNTFCAVESNHCNSPKNRLKLTAQIKAVYPCGDVL